MRDTRLDNLFPVQNVNSDMVIKGELQVKNYQDNTLFHIDPVTDSAVIMGKFGINQELHEVKGMMDIDNLSNRNMKDFINRFSPLILKTLKSMSSEGYAFNNPFQLDNYSINPTVSEPGIKLKIYNSESLPLSLTNEDRFAILQARVESPLRAYIVTDLKNIKKLLNDSIRELQLLISSLENQQQKALEAEADARMWATIIEVALAVTAVVLTIATAGIAAGGIEEMSGYIGNMVAEAIKIAVAESYFRITDNTDFVARVSNVEDASSDEIQQYIDDAKDRITATDTQITKIDSEIEKAKKNVTIQQQIIDDLDGSVTIQSTATNAWSYALMTHRIYTEYSDRTQALALALALATGATGATNPVFSSIKDVLKQYQKIKKSNLDTGFGLYIQNLIKDTDNSSLTGADAITFLQKQITDKLDVKNQSSANIQTQQAFVVNSTIEETKYETKYNVLQGEIDKLQQQYNEANFYKLGIQWIIDLFEKYPMKDLTSLLLLNLLWDTYKDPSSNPSTLADIGWRWINIFIYPYIFDGANPYFPDSYKPNGAGISQTPKKSYLYQYINDQTGGGVSSDGYGILYDALFLEYEKYVTDKDHISSWMTDVDWTSTNINRLYPAEYSFDKTGRYGQGVHSSGYDNFYNTTMRDYFLTEFSTFIKDRKKTDFFSFEKATYTHTTFKNGGVDDSGNDITKDVNNYDDRDAWMTDLKERINTKTKERDSLEDDLQNFTTNNNWDANTHNTLKTVISNLYKLNELYSLDSHAKFTVVMPVTDKTDVTTSIYYLTISVYHVDILEKKVPHIRLNGRSLSVNEFTRDKSYRDTLLKFINSLTSASQLVNYGLMLAKRETLAIDDDLSKKFKRTYYKIINADVLAGVKDVSITNEIQKDGTFLDRFGDTSLRLVIDDMTYNKVIQHEIYPHWNGMSHSKLFLQDTNTSLKDYYELMNTSFVEEYGFEPITTTTITTTDTDGNEV